MDAKTALHQAIDITDEILELLEQGDFERVNRLEGQRKPLIEQVFMASVEEIDVIRAHHLKNLNQQVVDKLNLLKQSIMLQQARIRTASKANRVYQSVDSGPTNSIAV